MYIIDSKGNRVGVTDLSLAIMQADDYRHYQLSGSANTDYNHRQQVYWEDIYLKLMILAEQSDQGPNQQNKI